MTNGVSMSGKFELSVSGAKLRSLSANQIAPTLDKFGGSIAFALWAQRHSQFWVGDLIAQGEAVFGDEIYQVIDDHWSADLISRCAAVSIAVPRTSRVDGLGWSHHAQVCKMPIEDQRAMLLKAKQDALSSTAFRAVVRESRRQ